MGRTEILFIVIKIFYWLFKMSGLCPYHFVSHSKKIQTAWYEIVISLINLIIFSYFHRNIGTRLMALTLNPQLAIEANNLEACAGLILFIDQFARARVIASLLTDARDILMESIQQLNIFEHLNVWTSIGKVSVKIVFGLGIFLLSSYEQLAILFETFGGFVDHFGIVMISAVYSLIFVIPNIFYAFVVGASIQYERINQKIQHIHKKAERIDRKRYRNDFVSRSNNRLNYHLTQELDYLANLHGKLTELIMNINGQFTVPLLMFYTSCVVFPMVEVI